MNRRLVTCACAAIVAAMLSACKDKTNVPEAPAAPPEITVVAAEAKDIPIYAEFVGQTYGKFDIAIRARVEGFLEGIHFEEGSNVTKGQLLYTIDPQPFETKVAEARSKVAEANTLLVKSEADLNRVRPLAEQNAVSKADLDEAEAQYGAAKASVEAAEASLELTKIQLSYATIKAPISGLIGKTEAKEGDFVGREPNPVVLNAISQLDKVLVRFSIPEADYLRIVREYKEQQATAGNRQELELILADGSVHDYPGSIDFAEREIDPSTGTLLLQASFPNPDLILRPGQYAKVRVLERVSQNAIVIPNRCVMELQGKFSVFVVGEGNTVDRRLVTLGPRVGDMVIVEEGLQKSDRVVIDALQKVSSGTEIQPVEITFESQNADQL